MESDEELMLAVAQGDERALATLVDRHAAPLHGFLIRLSGDPHDAEDLLQETWVRIARAANSFDAARRFRPWAYGVAANLARDLHRRQRVRREARADPPLAGPEAGALERMDMRGRLARLPERLRTVLVMRYYEGLDEAEMAQALGVPRGTVKSRLHAAIGELRRQYEETP